LMKQQGLTFKPHVKRDHLLDFCVTESQYQVLHHHLSRERN